jgi:DNA-directed RNA polymerase subunit beta'
MLSTNNILKLSDGRPIVSPTQDMVIGSYYLTQVKEGAKGEGTYFSSPEEAKMAYFNKDIELQAKINVRVRKTINGVEYKKTIIGKNDKEDKGEKALTVGRIIFNEAIPQDLGIVPRETSEQMLDYEISYLVGKKQLSDIVERCFKKFGATEVAVVLDKIKTLGFKYSTIGAITASVFDMKIDASKKEVIARAEKDVADREKQFLRGLLTAEERYNEVIDIWKNATESVEKNLEKNFEATDKFNPIWMMAKSGARGSMQQIKQLSGMRGLMNDPKFPLSHPSNYSRICQF